MKLPNHPPPNSFDEIFEWLASIDPSRGLSERDYGNLDSAADFFEADGWEIGPGLYNRDKWMLAFSEISPALRERWIDHIPKILGWEVYLDLPPKDWEMYFEVPQLDSMLKIDGRLWKYRTESIANEKIELSITPQDIDLCYHDEIYNIAKILLVGEIGETNFKNTISNIYIESHPKNSNAPLGDFSNFLSSCQFFVAYREILKRKRNGAIIRPHRDK